MKTTLSLFALLLSVSAIAAGDWPTPTPTMRPWAYNWWMGSSVDEAGLRLQADEMTRVGMGGYHVIPIYSEKDDPNEKVLLSADWMSAFRTAVGTAGEKGLGVDLTTGSGWCFGGPMLSPEEGCRMLQLGTKKLKNATILWRGKDAKGKEVVLSTRPTGQKVKRSGPGGHGPMMNPLSPAAMAKFLAPFKDAFGSPDAARPRSMYHDSYEYFSAGWAPELPEAFAKRRGYRLEDHYDALAGAVDEDTVSRVKCDYRETISDLMVEDVFPLWTAWCRSLGMMTRNEAHGAPANWLDFYALADVPETEMFSCEKRFAQTPSITARFMNSGDRDILVSKFASSAAHVKHAGAAADPLVSAESCTWATEHFCETLGSLKTFIDRLFLSGVNHMFYHGMCYSPAAAKWPGRTFYATAEMNRFNPIWRDADVLNAYITRVQSVAQTMAIDNDLLVYWPIHDFWSKPDGFELQMSVHARDWLGGQPLGRISRRLYDEGYAFDFISERQLMSLDAPSKTRYRAIVVPGAKRLKPETLRRFFALAKAGYQVLFVDGFPTTVPGLRDVAAREAELKALLSQAPSGVRAGTYEELLPTAGVRREPFSADSGLRHTRHATFAADGTREATAYFIANQDRDAGVTGSFRPSVPCARAVLMDPMTGAVRELAVTDGAFALDLPIGHSVIVKVFPTAAAKFAASAKPAAATRQVALDGDWTRTPVAGGPDFPSVRTGRLPLAWGEEDDEAPEARFAGTMRYETTVSLASPGEGGDVTLDLGRVDQSAKVFVNGTYAAGVILPPWRVRLPRTLFREGANTIAVEVTSTGANRLRWLDRTKPYEWKKFTDINMVDINYKKFDASGWKKRTQGLSGPVTLSY